MRKIFIMIFLLFISIVNIFAIDNFFSICESGSLEDVKKAISEGVEINSRDEDGWTPLMYAASYNEDLEVVDLLFESGASPYVVSRTGKNPLMYAVLTNKNPRIVPLLIKKGVPVDAVDENGLTALMYAAGDGKNPMFIEELLLCGADIKKKSRFGLCAFDYATSNDAIKNTYVYQLLKY